MELQTVVDVSSSDGVLLGTACTRAELESMLGMVVRSRNEDNRSWRVADATAFDSLCGIDEVSCSIDAKKCLTIRLVQQRK